MKVAVQALGIHTGGGPYNHLQGFLRELATHRSQHDWTFTINSAFDPGCAVPDNVHLQRVKVHRPWQRLYEDNIRQRVLLEHSRPDVLLNLIDFGPLPASIPTLSFQRNPNYYDVRLLKLRRGFDRAVWEGRRQLAYRVVRHSDRVLCPSETMADAVRRAVRTPPGRVGSLLHPYDGSRSSLPWAPGEPPRILYTGHLMPHKNHQWLLDVFIASGLAKEGVELWMTAARPKWPEGYDALVRGAAAAGISASVRLLGRVPPSEMPALYSAATIFAFASAGESFGHPMVEAMSAGLPVVAYDTPIAREILRDAAIYLPPDTGTAGALLGDVVRSDRSTLEHLSNRSLSRANAICLSWADWVCRVESELLDLAQGRHP